MKLTDTLLISGAIGFFLIGLMGLFKTDSFAYSYESFMFMMALFGIFMLRKKNRADKERKANDQ